MSRERRSRRRSGQWNARRGAESPAQPKKHFHAPKAVTPEQIKEEEEAIRAFKSANQIECARCHEVIMDLSQAMQDKELGKPIHFDCALEQLSNTERLAADERIAYIGQGRFGVITYANPRDMKHFTIKKIIEWEARDQECLWRTEMAGLYSRVR